MEIQFILPFISGIIIGVVGTVIFQRKTVENEKAVSLLITALWLMMHTFSFFKGGDVSLLFDIIGFGTVGHIVGLDLPLLINKIRGK